MLNLTKTILATAIAATLGLGTVQTAAAQVRGVVTIREAPPPLRNEAVPAPRRGYHWVPGYWNWQGRRHVWHAGTWVRARPGYAYTNPSWVERDGRWEFQRGRWARGDQDGDGVPNGVDRRPNDPTRR
jgi:WXXGXW repeat (2 copies)